MWYINYRMEKMTKFSALKKQMLKNPRVQKEYDALGPEYELIAEHALAMEMKTFSKKPAKRAAKGYIIGRAGFAKISAVEGIKLTPSVHSDDEKNKND